MLTFTSLLVKHFKIIIYENFGPFVSNFTTIGTDSLKKIINLCPLVTRWYKKAYITTHTFYGNHMQFWIIKTNRPPPDKSSLSVKSLLSLDSSSCISVPKNFWLVFFIYKLLPFIYLFPSAGGPYNGAIVVLISVAYSMIPKENE